MAKTLSFGVIHVGVAFSVGYLMTGSLAVGGTLALVEPVVNTLAYHLHEKLWARKSGLQAPQPASAVPRAWAVAPLRL